MSALKSVLEETLPGVKVVEKRGRIELELPGGSKARFRIESEPEDVRDDEEPSVLFLARADPRTITALRGRRSSFVTAQGTVFLVSLGVYVDIRPARGSFDADRTRNPFSTRGRQVCVALLRHPQRSWTVRELATASSASESFVSRVISALDDQGFVETQDSGFQPRPEFLFAALAEHWPRPTSFFVGRVPSKGEAVIGGGPAYENMGLVIPALPRVYVASRDQLRLRVVDTNSTPSTARMADWEAVIQPLPIMNGLVPELIVALELAREPRGREVLRERSLLPWPIHV